MSDIVYVPAVKPGEIKESIILDPNPVYEDKGVKYQGYYRDAHSKEVRGQTLRHIDGYLDNGTLTRQYAIKKRFIVTSITMYKYVAAAGAAAGGVWIGRVSASGSVSISQFYFKHSGVTGINEGLTWDFTASPLIFESPANLIEVGTAALPGANDIIYYHIAGFEED